MKFIDLIIWPLLKLEEWLEKLEDNINESKTRLDARKKKK